MTASETHTYLVTGMSCSHCENAIRSEVSGIAGVDSVSVSAANGRLEINVSAPVSDADVIAAVAEAGYEATPAS